ncbi:MAG TPA: hypothetical protein VEK06_05380, partial [Myxococcota bacterium]|nr:hypothetical protein [Myxococcota bacterium]
LEARIGEINKYETNEQFRHCIYYSAELIRNLSDYADFASKSPQGDGLDKFVANWKTKATIDGEEATIKP